MNRKRKNRSNGLKKRWVETHPARAGAVKNIKNAAGDNTLRGEYFFDLSSLQDPLLMIIIYFTLKNLLLWARSEFSDSA
jgi:hypothetical protein